MDLARNRDRRWSKISKDLFDELLNSYKKTGYTKLALLNQAS